MYNLLTNSLEFEQSVMMETFSKNCFFSSLSTVCRLVIYVYTRLILIIRSMRSGAFKVLSYIC